MAQGRPAKYQRATQALREQQRDEAAQRLHAEAATPEGIRRIEFREAEVARRRREVRESALAFIYRYVKIESGDPESPIIPFALWADQAGVLKELLLQKLIIVLKARQLGLTWLVLAYALWRMLTVPGFSVIGISKTDDDTKELIRRCTVILQNLPKWLCRKVNEAEPGWKGPVWDSQTHLLVIRHPGGQDSRFVADSASPDSGRSFTAMLVILDEWAYQEYAREIWQAAGPTMNRARSGQVIGLSTAETGTLFEEKFLEALAGKNDFFPIFLPWWTDPERDEAWYERSKREYPNEYQKIYPASVAEAFAVGARKFFPEWEPRIHVFSPDKVLSDEWWRFRGMDWGFNAPFCVLYGAVDYDGDIWVYRELYSSGMTASEVAGWILDVEEAAEEDVHMGPADCQISIEIGTTGPTIEEEFMRAGVFWEAPDKARKAGWQQVHSRLCAMQYEDEKGEPLAEPKPAPTLHISAACVELIREIEQAKSDKFIPDQLARNSKDHCLDALRYMLMFRPYVPQKKEKKPARFERYMKSENRRGTWMAW